MRGGKYFTKVYSVPESWRKKANTPLRQILGNFTWINSYNNCLYTILIVQQRIMTQKIKKKENERIGGSKSFKDNEIPDMRFMEKDNWILSKIFEKDMPEDLEEANSRAQKIISGGSYRNFKPENKASEAQMIAYDSFGAKGAKRLELAKKALEIYPNCADAYVSLAEMERGKKQRLELYRKGVDAGRADLGEEYFRENMGHFYGLIETRPFMRAYYGYGNTLWDLGNFEEALKIYREMIKLNPQDNQGVRYSIITISIKEKKYDDALEIMSQYGDEPSAEMRYNSALLLLKKQGLSFDSKKALREAFDENKYVPAIIIEAVKPAKNVGYITIGGIDEATAYIEGNLENWMDDNRLLKWMLEEFIRYMG